MKISNSMDADLDNTVEQDNGIKRVLDSDSDEEILFSITKKKKLQILDDNSDDDDEGPNNFTSHPSSNSLIIANETPVENPIAFSNDIFDAEDSGNESNVSVASKQNVPMKPGKTNENAKKSLPKKLRAPKRSKKSDSAAKNKKKDNDQSSDDDLPLIKLQNFANENGNATLPSPEKLLSFNGDVFDSENFEVKLQDEPETSQQKKKNAPRKPRKKKENANESVPKKPRVSKKNKISDTSAEHKNEDNDQSSDDDLPLIKLQHFANENGNATLPSPEKLLSFNNDVFDSENFEIKLQDEPTTPQQKKKNTPKNPRKKKDNMKESVPKKPRISKKNKISDTSVEHKNEPMIFSGDVFDTEDSEFKSPVIEALQLDENALKKQRKRKDGTKENVPKKPRIRKNKKKEMHFEQDEEPVHLNRDIFDTDETDQVNGDTSLQENLLDSEYLPENPKKSKPKKVKNKKEKKEVESEKVREKEMFDIHSENQRLLRELSVKLPYRKAQKCSLDEFLRNRRKQSLPNHHDGELSLPDITYTLPVCINSETSCSKENVKQNNSIAELNDVCNNLDTLNKDFSEEQCQVATESGINQISKNIVASELEENIPNDVNFKLHEDYERHILCEKLTDGQSIKVFDSKVEENLSHGAVDEKQNQMMSSGSPERNISHAEIDISNSVLVPEANVLCETDIEKENEVDENLKSLESVSHELQSEKQTPLEQEKENCLVEESNPVESKVVSIEYEVEASVEKLLTDICESVPDMTTTAPSKFICMKQRVLEAAKSFTPCIFGNPNEVIDLSESFIDGGIDSSHLHDDGLVHFVEKFVSHTKEVNKKRGNQEVKLSIVSRDDSNDGELHLSEIYVDVSHNEEEQTADKPGAKLLKLKERLLDKIMQKKEEEFKKRKELEMMDNENQPDEDEEEAELTDDDSDADEIMEGDNVNEDNADIDGDIDDEEEEEEEEEEFSVLRKKRKTNPLIDDEASESNGSENSYSSIQRHSELPHEDEDKSISKDVEFVPKSNSNVDVSKEQSRLLYLESDSEDSFKDDVSKISNYEISSSAIPCYQPGGGFTHLNEQQSRDENHSELDDTLKSQASDMNDSVSPAESQPENSQQLWPSQNFVQSSAWRNGLSELKSTPDVSDLVTNAVQSQNNMDDLLALCSGNFADSCEVSTPVHSISPKDADESLLKATNVSQDEKSIFEHSRSCSLDESAKFSMQSSRLSMIDKSMSESHMASNIFAKPHPDPDKIAKELNFNSTQTDINDALEFCSGTFTSRPLSPAVEAEDFIQDDNFDRMSCTSLPVIQRKRLRLLSGSDNDEVDGKKEEEDDDNDDDRFSTDSYFNADPSKIDPDDDVMQEEMEGMTDINKVNKVNDYFEEEAELSGSDVGSDADADVDEDGYLEDLIHDGELYSEDDLRNQIGKVHLKKLLDEDKRQLRLYQELYLEDGDLHSEGPGRQRKFTWRNSGALDFVGGEEGASESEHEDAPEEEKWRLERHEREQWLREQEDKEDVPKISPVKFKSRSSLKLEIVNKVTETTPTAKNFSSTSNASSTTKMIYGSILARGQDYLSGLAKRLKKGGGDDNTTGSRTTKHFVFRAISPKKEAETKKNTLQDKSLRPSTSTAKVVHSINGKSKKRKSVFDYLDTV